MTSLVLEGGTLRGIFSAGVMDAFLKEGIEFEYIVGVSAGISNAASYVSKQFQRNLEILEKYRLDKRYIGVQNYVDCKSLFGLDFVFDDIPNKLVPFDYTTFREYKGKFLVGMYNAEKGRTEFVNGIKDSRKWNFLRGTCAIPGYFPPAKIGGYNYYDGGLASPICINKAMHDGCDKHIIILTQPEGYIKQLNKSNIAMSQVIKHRFPKLEMTLLCRHKIYNHQVQLCEQLEREGKAIIIRPEYRLSNFEKNIDTIKSTWQHGFNITTDRIDEIKEFICAE